MPSQTKENYLKAMYHLVDEEGQINISDLSKHLEVKMPTVTSMIKKLQEEGWVVYEKYKPVVLTEVGKRKAALILRKHRLTEMFLVEKMGFGWEEVHSIAEQLEHISNELFFDKMDKMLGYPKEDPHGSPIPRKDGSIELHDYHKLSDMQEGDCVIVRQVSDTSTALLKLLSQKEISIGTELFIDCIQEFDQSFVVNYDSHEGESLSSEVCRHLMVELN